MQNANRRCTGHATMSTERGNYRLITVHAPVPTRVIHCAFIALQSCTPSCLKHFCEFPNNTLFSLLLQKENKPTQSATIALTFWIYRTFWFCVIARKGVCTVLISRSFARSVDIVAWSVQPRFAFCTLLKV